VAARGARAAVGDTGVQDMELQSESLGRRLQVSQLGRFGQQDPDFDLNIRSAAAMTNGRQEPDHDLRPER
jgi:hypothetical protein